MPEVLERRIRVTPSDRELIVVAWLESGEELDHMDIAAVRQEWVGRNKTPLDFAMDTLNNTGFNIRDQLAQLQGVRVAYSLDRLPGMKNYPLHITRRVSAFKWRTIRAYEE